MSEDDDFEDISAVDADESASLLLPCCGRTRAVRSEQESTLDAEVSQIDGVAGGSTESHREQAESSGSKRANQTSRLSPRQGSVIP